MKVAFWDNYLCERGTTVAVFDYAYYNQTLLNNESVILYNSSIPASEQSVIEKFKRYFKVYGAENFAEAEKKMLEEEIDVFYIIKSGENEGQFSKKIKTCVHCVYNANDPHGHVYSTIAPWVPGTNGVRPVVPHMVNLPNHDKNLRDVLNIPDDATVFGGYGGKDNFSINYVRELVFELANSNPNMYFIFANYPKFCDDLPNIIHMPMVVDLDKKVSFINTCDAMLWASKYGETMSMAQGEFCVRNKPIICTEIGILGHKHLLKDQAIWYFDKEDLRKKLLNFDRKEVSKKDWNAYKEYTPEKVMKIFKEIYLDS